jgi:hypothetical protein
MADPYAVSRYFQIRANAWIQADGSVEAHIRRVGKQGLAGEFGTDKSFGEVCELVQEFGELQARAHIVKSLEGFIGDQFSWPLVGEMDIIIGAMALACGFKTLGEKLVWTGVAALAIAGIAAAALGSRESNTPEDSADVADKFTSYRVARRRGGTFISVSPQNRSLRNTWGFCKGWILRAGPRAPMGVNRSFAHGNPAQRRAPLAAHTGWIPSVDRKFGPHLRCRL